MTEEQKLRRKEKQAIYHRQWQIKNADKLNKYQRDRRKNILSAAGASGVCPLCGGPCGKFKVDLN